MSWPGLSVADDDMKIDPDALIEAAEVLERQLRSLTGDTMGTPTSLRTEATIPSGQNWFGRWNTAIEMEDRYRLARDGMLFFYDELILQLTKAIGVLRATAAENQGSDESGRATFNAQTNALEATGSPPASSSGNVAVP